MKLNYDALQELYDTLTFGPILSSPYAESPIDRAFKECDEKLSESIAFDYLKKLQDRCDNLERSNKALRDDNDKLGDKVIELEKERDAKSKANVALISANTDLSDRQDKLQRNFDRINHLWTVQIQENMELRSKIANLQEPKPKLVDYEALRKELDDVKQDKDGWRKRAEQAEKRIAELLEKKYDQSFEDLKKRNYELECDRYFYFNKYQELKKDYERVTEEMEKSRKCHRQIHVGEGARHLWDMLQNVNDTQPDEFDVECESMHDVISMDLDDFLDAYKKWQEKKETYRMRKWLDDFCAGKQCKGCPLESEEYKCGCGYSFRGTNPIPDEDIKRYYEKARGCGQYTLKDATFNFDNQPVKMENGKLFIHDLSHPTAGVNRAISKACEDFCKAVRDADNKITENLCKGCTLEATVEVDKDLLNAVCGVKPKEEEEHQLEYGDAVRVPWRDYDYMYIGPEGEHIRLFDPKTHTVVVVSVRDNLTYQGCKIILCDEDDIRKIWKDKK